MSTSWGLRCLTCQKESEYMGKSAEHFLREVWANRSILMGALKVMRTGQEMWRLDIYLMEGRLENPVDFMLEHEGHTIALYNEYGNTEELQGLC